MGLLYWINSHLVFWVTVLVVCAGRYLVVDITKDGSVAVGTRCLLLTLLYHHKQ